ncbi:MAG: hypothetical protein IKF52_04870 [Clostridia bacterium]|nr:hypothetical protein [Clostridia bacterium]
MRLNLRKNKGITLVALVITIIVLLILAGVTLAMVLGDNGIVTRTNEAKKATEDAETEEKLQLAGAGLQMDYLSSSEGGTYRDYIFSETGQSTLKEELGIPEGDTTTIVFNITNYTITYKGLIFIVSENGDITRQDDGESGSSGITKDNYGDYVDIGLDINNNGNTKDDFKVFLKDDSSIYLIAANYLPMSMCPQSKPKVTGRTTRHSIVADGTYYGNWNADILNDYNGATDISGNSLLSSSYNSWANKSDLDTYYANRNNAKAMAYILDTDAWGDLISSNNSNKSLINYVIGSPTLEMLTDSYNQKYYNVENFESKYKMGWFVQGSYGYEVKKGEYWPEISFNGYYTDSSDELYFICYPGLNYGSVWIASGMYDDGDYKLYTAETSSSLIIRKPTLNVAGFRPVVSLKSGVNLVDNNSDGVFELQ